MPETPTSPFKLFLGRMWGKLPAELRSKLWWISVLYFAEGFPFGIVYKVFPVYFRTHGMDLSSVGLLALARVPYTIKAAWAPFVDRYGSRQAWIAASEVGLAFVIPFLIVQDASQLTVSLWLVIIALIFLSATQDIAIDAYAIDVSTPRDAGYINGFRAATYRAATLFAGSVLLALSDVIGWTAVWWIAAGLCLVLAYAAWRSPRVPREHAGTVTNAGTGAGAAQSNRTRNGARIAAGVLLLAGIAFLGVVARQQKWPGYLTTLLVVAGGLAVAAVLSPELMRWIFRIETLPILLFGIFYKVGDNALGQMVEPFWVDRGFSNTEIAAVSNGIGVALQIAGALLGGWFVAKRGIFQALLWMGLAQIVSNFGYVAVASLALPAKSIYVASMIESITQGLGTAAFLSFLMNVCDRTHAATQYALLSAAFSLSRDVAGAFSGFGVEAMGYAGYFTLTACLALPGMLLLPWVRGRIREGVG